MSSSSTAIMDALPSASMMNGQHGDTLQQCMMFVDEQEILIGSRARMPRELAAIFGFVEWNRLCDRLDESLLPLRELVDQAKTIAQGGETQNRGDNVETSSLVISPHEEERAKALSLQNLQKVCDRVAQLYPMLEFTLFCPFHGSLVENWHLQVTVDGSNESNPRSSGETATENYSMREGHNASRQNSSTQEENSSTSAPIEESDQDAFAESGDATNSNPSPGNKENEEEEVAIKSNTFYGREGKGVLGVDYIEHKVSPTDTLSGICLTYKISATRLKQANLMDMTNSGAHDSLLLAPAVLAIPLDQNDKNHDGSGEHKDGYYARVQNEESSHFKLNALRSKFSLEEKEALAYLELADWVLQDAMESARGDLAWEEAQKGGL